MVTINQGKIIILGLQLFRFHIQLHLKILSSKRQRCILWMFYHYLFLMSVPWIRWLVTSHSCWTSGFNPTLVQVGFMVDRGTPGSFFLGCFVFPCIHSVSAPSTFIHLALVLYNRRNWQFHWISHLKLFYFLQLDLILTYEYWIISNESSSSVLIAWFQSKDSVRVEFWQILCCLVLRVLCQCSSFH